MKQPQFRDFKLIRGPPKIKETDAKEAESKSIWIWNKQCTTKLHFHVSFELPRTPQKNKPKNLLTRLHFIKTLLLLLLALFGRAYRDGGVVPAAMAAAPAAALGPAAGMGRPSLSVFSWMTMAWLYTWYEGRRICCASSVWSRT